MEDFAYEWSNNVKKKIIKESHIESDKVKIDSTKQNSRTIIYWKGNRKLREFSYDPVSKDTFLSIFYSKNQEFELIRELCPSIEPSFEGISYKGKHLGLVEFRFCNGEISETGFRFKGDIGVWKEYGRDGSLIKTQDLGNSNKLYKLKEIKYK